MGAIDMFNDFVKLIESESLPVEAVAIADGDAIVADRHLSALRSKMACCRSIRDWSIRFPSMFPPIRNRSWARSLRFCRIRVLLLRFNARNLAISIISFALLCMSICCFRLLPERTTFAYIDV